MAELDRRNFLTCALASLGLTASTLPLSRIFARPELRV